MSPVKNDIFQTGEKEHFLTGVDTKGLKCFSYKVLKHLNTKDSEYNKKLRSPLKLIQKIKITKFRLPSSKEVSGKTF